MTESPWIIGGVAVGVAFAGVGEDVAGVSIVFVGVPIRGGAKEPEQAVATIISIPIAMESPVRNVLPFY